MNVSVRGCACVSHRLTAVCQRVAGVTRDKSLSLRLVSVWEAAPRVKRKRRVWERGGRRTAIITGLMGRTNGASGSNYRPFLTPTHKRRPSCWGALLARPGVTECRPPGGNSEALQGHWKRPIHFENGSLFWVRLLVTVWWFVGRVGSQLSTALWSANETEKLWPIIWCISTAFADFSWQPWFIIRYLPRGCYL